MAKRRTGRKRGRPYNPEAKRHRTDRMGRRGEVDLGSDWLRAKKLRLTTRGDVEMDGAGILFGRDLLDRPQYDQLSVITLLLRRITAACGRGYTVHGLWQAIIAAGSRTGYTVPLLGDMNARQALAQVCERLNGSRALVTALAEGQTPPIVLRAVAHQLTAEDAVALQELRASLDDLVSPRRSPRLLAQDVGASRTHPMNAG
jgi:hypothetical protein